MSLVAGTESVETPGELSPLSPNELRCMLNLAISHKIAWRASQFSLDPEACSMVVHLVPSSAPLRGAFGSME